MKRIKILTIGLLTLTACSKYATVLYALTGMTSFNADNSGVTPVDATDTVNARAYCIRLHVTGEKTGTSGKGSEVKYESSTHNEDILSGFEIVCLNYFDSAMTAGSVMNDYFLFSSRTTYSSSSTMASMISRNLLGSGLDVFDEIMETDNYLFLMVEPENPGNYTFVTTAYYQNGKVFSDTVSIYLK